MMKPFSILRACTPSVGRLTLSRPSSLLRAFSSAATAPSSKSATETEAVKVKTTLSSQTDEALLQMLVDGELSVHRLEGELEDCTRAVFLRRQFLAHQLGDHEYVRKGLSKVPMNSFNEDQFYNSIHGANCEAVIGYVPLPLGVVGPVKIDGRTYSIPMATTEGALVASTNRGCRAITMSGGAATVVMGDGMTRAPLVRMPSIQEVARLREWIETPENYAKLEDAFNSTTRFGRIQSIQTVSAGRNVYMRFKCFTGDAMGMNMITKGVNKALSVLAAEFPEMQVLALSGNFCTDKKPSAVNWVQGRGKTVSCEVTIPRKVVKEVLKSDIEPMISLNQSKNLVGSAMAGSVGGYNAHSSNIVSAVFLATGQDPAQNVESSTCITLMEHDRETDSLVVSVTMPSIEVGTVGGGTSLPAQAGCLEMLGVKGASAATPGSNSRTLATVVAGAVLAGELSLMAALCSGHLMTAHERLNRKQPKTTGGSGAGAEGVTAAVSAKSVLQAKEAAHSQSHHDPRLHPRGQSGHVLPASFNPGRRYFAAVRGPEYVNAEPYGDAVRAFAREVKNVPQLIEQCGIEIALRSSITRGLIPFMEMQRLPPECVAAAFS